MSSLRLTPSNTARVTAIDLAMMERALELAEQAASMDEVPVGAVVYRGNKIIAEGYNLRESSSFSEMLGRSDRWSFAYW